MNPSHLFYETLKMTRNKEYGKIFIAVEIKFTGNAQPGGAGSGVWTRGSMIARERKFGRVRLSTNALKINMEDVPSIVAFENLSWSSSVNRLLLLFILVLVNLHLLWRKSQTSWMESKRLVEESLTAESTCSHLMQNLLKGFWCQALVL